MKDIFFFFFQYIISVHIFFCGLQVHPHALLENSIVAMQDMLLFSYILLEWMMVYVVSVFCFMTRTLRFFSVYLMGWPYLFDYYQEHCAFFITQVANPTINFPLFQGTLKGLHGSLTMTV
jgi:hypothetical protein